MRQAPGPMRIGLDLVSIETVAASVADLGDRYLGFVYTDRERAECAGAPEIVAAHLAGRFAVKEAVMKLLGAPAGLSWQEIETIRSSTGACALHLSGAALEAAQAQGVVHMAVSIAHEEGMAAAVVVGMCDG